MRVDEQQILSVSRDLWTDRFGLNIETVNGSGDHAEEKTISSVINVSGPWRGTIVVECSESIVRHAAAMLFETDGQAASQEDIADALKELTFMVGQRVTRLMPEPSKLSRPSIVDGDEPHEGHDNANEFRLSCEGRPLRISLLEAETEPATAG